MWTIKSVTKRSSSQCQRGTILSTLKHGPPLEVPTRANKWEWSAKCVGAVEDSTLHGNIGGYGCYETTG
jgi:hypothetical protein